jgi:hypothetical protein
LTVTKALIAMLALAALAIFRVGRLILGTVGLWQVLGPPWAIAGLAALVLLRLTIPIRVGVVLAVIYLWGLPWIVALLLAAPRLPLMLPGLISMALARVRHPPPVWRAIDSASL